MWSTWEQGEQRFQIRKDNAERCLNCNDYKRKCYSLVMGENLEGTDEEKNQILDRFEQDARNKGLVPRFEDVYDEALIPILLERGYTQEVHTNGFLYNVIAEFFPVENRPYNRAYFLLSDDEYIDRCIGILQAHIRRYGTYSCFRYGLRRYFLPKIFVQFREFEVPLYPKSIVHDSFLHYVYMLENGSSLLTPYPDPNSIPRWVKATQKMYVCVFWHKQARMADLEDWKEAQNKRRSKRLKKKSRMGRDVPDDVWKIIYSMLYEMYNETYW